MNFRKIAADRLDSSSSHFLFRMRSPFINNNTAAEPLATPRQYHQEAEQYFTCRVVVERSQFGGQDVLDPVQNPVVGRSERSHDPGYSDCRS